MSSRLNPRDYDLGELRDAVQEVSESEEQRRADSRRGRTDRGRAQTGADRRGDAGPRRQEPTKRGGYGDTSGPAPRRAAASDAAEPTTERPSETGREPSDDVEREPEPSSGVEPEPEPNSPDEVDQRPNSSGETEQQPEPSNATGSRAADADAAAERRQPSRGRDEPRRVTPTERDVARHSAPESPARTEAAVSQADHELLSQLSRQGVERPYLTRIPDEYTAQMEIFDWLEHLVSTAGHGSTLDALAYYESLGWLSEQSRQSLEEFVEGLAGTSPPDPGPLGVDDHRFSLLHIARLSHRLY